LLSSGFTVTYAHHSLIHGYRKGGLYAMVFTVGLALIFTVLQGLEYTVSCFTLSDSTYGSCFYFGTGFHGLNNVAPYIIIYILLKTKKIYSIQDNAEINNKLLIHIPSYKDKQANSYYLQKNFLE